MTSFWNGKLGTLIDEVNAHKADVLCLCLSEDQKTLYSAGKLNSLVQLKNGYNIVGPLYDIWLNRRSRSGHSALCSRHSRCPESVDSICPACHPHPRRTQSGPGRFQINIRRYVEKKIMHLNCKKNNVQSSRNEFRHISLMIYFFLVFLSRRGCLFVHLIISSKGVK